jgi:TetR/AcrR family transcriptional regulator, cholesterol catabolism regulator
MKKTGIRTYSNNTDLVTERREHIARSVAPLFVKQGYERTSIRDIAKACGMSMGHLYYYIGSKEDVLQLMMDYDQHFYTNFAKQVVTSYSSLTPTEALTKVIDELFRGIEGIPDFMRFFYQEIKNLQPTARGVIMERERQVIAELENLLRRGCDAGEFKVNNVTIIANNILFIGHMWSLRRFLFPRGYTIDEYIQCQTENILRSVGIDPDVK